MSAAQKRKRLYMNELHHRLYQLGISQQKLKGEHRLLAHISDWYQQGLSVEVVADNCRRYLKR